jgi:hypothetical protein|tara:strand:+ start:88 stop:573 length:486 start_codon:yes stop_codon:yes gene_type:complete
MDEYIRQIISAALLSPFIGIGTWLKWQTMKTGTMIPNGIWTQQKGRITGWAIQLFAFMNFVFVSIDPFGWHLIIVFLVIWCLSGWVATYIERGLYGTEDRIETIAYAAQSHGRNLRPEQLQEFLDGIAPQWWIRLMSWSWRQKLTDRINESLEEDHGDDAL